MQDTRYKTTTTPKTARKFDLEERTLVFAQAVRAFVQTLPRTLANTEDIKQLVRSSGSIGANYLEANDSLGEKDFSHRIKISRKEAKETRYWLQLIDYGDDADVDAKRDALFQEATELTKILSAIAQKVARRS